jgi:hypothetical protein
MLIDDPGNITIYMFSTPLVDIDFICWGPFEDPYEPCVSGLTAAKIVDCSYSPNPTEYCDITNAQTGEYYILLITNYSQQPCDITFEQTGGDATTDCTILPPPVSNNSPICVGETLELYADTVNNATYWWTGPNGFISGNQNPVILNATLTNAGDYTCTITVGGNSSDPAITTAVINQPPATSQASGDSTVCLGTPAYLLLNFTGFGPIDVEYTDGTNTMTATGLSPPTDTIFVYPDGPTTYTINEVCNQNCCNNVLGIAYNIDTYPYTSGSVSGDEQICAGEPVDLVFNLTGTPPWNVTYTANGANPQSFMANSSPHIEQVFPGENTIYRIESMEDEHCDGEILDSLIVNVNPAATVVAGNDQTIPYGTNTQLDGDATGGSGDYTIQWEPADKLLDPDALSTQTVNLTETTIFTLTVTDNQGDCPSADEMVVTIEGGPLGCNPSAAPSTICEGESTTLEALPSGGSGEYTFVWTSDPSGFNSDLPNPTVGPSVNTTYFVSVNDGFSVVNGSVAVTVNERPLPDAGTDQTIPFGTTTTLQGSAAGGSGNYSYHWEPAALLVDPDVQDPQTVNMNSTTLFSLTVTDLETGCTSENPSQVTLIVSGDALSANPGASPEEICKGEETQLFALPGGGSGNYTFQWTGSDGFTSTDENPVVQPGSTTTYSVTVNDGFNVASGSVAVTVHPTPEVYLGPPDTMVCVYDTVILDAGNDGTSYLWSNGSTEQSIKVGTTGIGFDMKMVRVMVTSENGCQVEDSINIIFDFSACLGIEEGLSGNKVKIYPNPNDGGFKLEITDYSGDLTMEVVDARGRTIRRAQFKDLKGTLIKDLSLKDEGSGLYLLRLTGDEMRYTHKVFVRQ